MLIIFVEKNRSSTCHDGFEMHHRRTIVVLKGKKLSRKETSDFCGFWTNSQKSILRDILKCWFAKSSFPVKKNHLKINRKIFFSRNAIISRIYPFVKVSSPLVWIFLIIHQQQLWSMRIYWIEYKICYIITTTSH